MSFTHYYVGARVLKDLGATRLLRRDEIRCEVCDRSPSFKSIRTELLFMPTNVEMEKVEYWKTQVPLRLHRFLDNFFGTCPRDLEPELNYLNYLRDIELYGATMPAYRECAEDLVEAFYDITSWRPREVVVEQPSAMSKPVKTGDSD